MGAAPAAFAWPLLCHHRSSQGQMHIPLQKRDSFKILLTKYHPGFLHIYALRSHSRHMINTLHSKIQRNSIIQFYYSGVSGIAFCFDSIWVLTTKGTLLHIFKISETPPLLKQPNHGHHNSWLDLFSPWRWYSLLSQKRPPALITCSFADAAPGSWVTSTKRRIWSWTARWSTWARRGRRIQGDEEEEEEEAVWS